MGQVPDRNAAQRKAESERRARERELRRRMREQEANDERVIEDPREVPLDVWLARPGTRTGTFTFNGVTYTDMNEVEWRTANSDWVTARPG